VTYQVKAPRKLIEVALPLDGINAACVREKNIRQGHPSALHTWWARRPQAAARAVLFAQLINDPGFQQGQGFRYGRNKKEAAAERQRLFKLIEDLVVWENTGNADLMEKARAEILRSWREVCELNKDHPDAAELFNPDRLPGFHDPFSGGGAIPLEAERLGLDAIATDLNPVAVLISKAMIEIPARFAGRSPVGPEREGTRKGRKLALPESWPGTKGLAEDVRRYGAWMRAEAERRIGHLYPNVIVTPELAVGRDDLQPLIGQRLRVVAWIWARTVASPNPAFSTVQVPLTASYVLCRKTGNEYYLAPTRNGAEFRFEVKRGPIPDEAEDGTKAKGRGADFRCIISGAAIAGDYIKSEGKAGRMGAMLMATVVEGPRGRIYLAPTNEMTDAATKAQPTWRPTGDVPARLTGGTCVPYGLSTWADLFTARQLTALATFSDLVIEARSKIRVDAAASGMSDSDERGLAAGGSGATAYAEAVATYLGCVVSAVSDDLSSLVTWRSGHGTGATRSTFARQSLPMVWDFAEANPFADAAGDLLSASEAVARAIDLFPGTSASTSAAFQADATTQVHSVNRIVSTDPPYYNNIAYADLSDFFYVWLRRTQKETFAPLFATLVTPKAEELVATPYRHGSKEKAESFFLDGMTRAMRRLAEQAHPAFPVTIYYAFKQSESENEKGTSSTGWETFLEAVLRAEFAITGTWPMRTERGNRSVGIGTNALASSIILVCRKRAPNATQVSRREFIRELNTVLPAALDEMTRGAGEERSPVAPVDLSQAIIGPGMAVFSKYAAVLEADGSPMSVRSALQLINRFLAEDDFDPDTQFALRWFEEHSWRSGKFGDADTLSRAKGTSVEGVKSAGILESGGGSVRLLKWSEYLPGWDPRSDTRTPVWETLHHLIRALKTEGESSAGQLLAIVVKQGEAARQLAYRLYTLCERLGWAEDARVYNEIITSWSSIESAASAASTEPVQGDLFD
jgi:putative DNA methylase